MPLAQTLSPADRTVVEVSLRRMLGDAFGALATLPVICLGELPSADPRRAVLDHYEIWRSCLVVARETIRSEILVSDSLPESLHQLLIAVAQLRDAYLLIAEKGSSTLEGYSQLKEIYDHLPAMVEALATELEIGRALWTPSSLKQAGYNRTLHWLGEEVRTRSMVS